MFYLEDYLTVKKGEEIFGSIALRPNEKNVVRLAGKIARLDSAAGFKKAFPIVSFSGTWSSLWSWTLKASCAKPPFRTTTKCASINS